MSIFGPKWRPVSVLTGFLGSGKTTVLQHLLAQPEMRGTALIINEFGEVSVDHLLVENAEEKIVLLSNGCVCCSVRGDLVTAIRSLFSRQKSGDIPPFERILLETTGLADPAPIVQSLIGPALTHFPVYFDSIATTLDASNALQAIVQNPQIRSQVAVADTLLITKTDLCAPEDIEAVISHARTFNPRAPTLMVANGVVPPRALFGQRMLDPTVSPRQLRKSIRSFEELIDTPEQLSQGSNHEGIHSFVIERDTPMSYHTLDTFMRTLCGYRGEDLLRVKGLVNVAGSSARPTVIHAVQSVLHPPTKLKKWPNKDRRTQLVFITRNISRDDVENMLDGIAGGFR